MSPAFVRVLPYINEDAFCLQVKDCGIYYELFFNFLFLCMHARYMLHMPCNGTLLPLSAFLPFAK